MQLRKENPCGPIQPAVKVRDVENVKEKALTTTIRRAITFYSSIQTHDGHWPAESAGPLFVIQPLVGVFLYIQKFISLLIFFSFLFYRSIFVIPLCAGNGTLYYRIT